MEFTEKNQKYFYELSEFKDLKPLEDNYQTILDKLIFLRENSKDGHWHQSFPYYLRVLTYFKLKSIKLNVFLSEGRRENYLKSLNKL